MKSMTLRLGALALVASLPLAACNKAETTTTEAGGETVDSGTKTLSASLGDLKDLSTLRGALDTAGLASLFDGPASYTLLAPNDAAFAALGARGEALMKEDQRALLAAVLRDHLLPGHLTPEAIEKAVVEKGGKVTMATLGEGNITFTQEGDSIIATSKDGSKAKVVGTATATSNGVIIPLDTVLLPKEDAAAQ